MEPVLCCAVTGSHLALGMPSGRLHLYDIAAILDSLLAFQAHTVQALNKTWRNPSEELVLEVSESTSSDSTGT